MALMRTSNPALNDKTWRGLPYVAGERMTMDGTVNKTGMLLVCSLATAFWTWHLFLAERDPAAVFPLMLLGVFGGLVFGLVTSFKREWAPVTAPVYALLEGLVLGGLSSLFEVRYPGIAMEAVCLTFGTLFVMLFLYRSRIIKVTDKLRLGIVAATGAVCLFYFLQMILGFFGMRFMSVYGSGPIGIGFSLIVVGIAALNLVLDFDFIERGVAAGAPKYMEWYGAFGIMVTLIWLYIEMLRLLSKVRSRN
jgi:uncharacterized YccA/Bax inhibitor family protein